MGTLFPPDITIHALRRCPICRTRITAAGTMDHQPGTPKPGDWTCCARCLQWLVYLDDFELRAVTNAEWLACSIKERRELTGQREMVRRAWASKVWSDDE